MGYRGNNKQDGRSVSSSHMDLKCQCSPITQSTHTHNQLTHGLPIIAGCQSYTQTHDVASFGRAGALYTTARAVPHRPAPKKTKTRKRKHRVVVLRFVDPKFKNGTLFFIKASTAGGGAVKDGPAARRLRGVDNHGR
jgi:hypothetical protein